MEHVKAKVSEAWNFLKAITTHAWGSMVNDIKSSINVIIGLINRVIKAWNSLTFKVPRVSIGGKMFGGQEFGVKQITEMKTLETTGRRAAPSTPLTSTLSALSSTGALDLIASRISSAIAQTSGGQQSGMAATAQEIIVNVGGSELVRTLLPMIGIEQGRIGSTSVVQTVGAR